MSDPANVKMGPCSVSFNGVDLGYTYGNSVAIKSEMKTTPIVPDQASLPIKEIVTGMTCEIEMTLLEVTATQYIALMPGASASGGGVQMEDPIGINQLARGKALILTPLDETDLNVYTFPNAAPLANLNVAFMKETPQGLQVKFTAYPKGGEGLDKKVYMTMIPAAAGAPIKQFRSPEGMVISSGTTLASMEEEAYPKEAKPKAAK